MRLRTAHKRKHAQLFPRKRVEPSHAVKHLGMTSNGVRFPTINHSPIAGEWVYTADGMWMSIDFVRS